METNYSYLCFIVQYNAWVVVEMLRPRDLNFYASQLRPQFLLHDKTRLGIFYFFIFYHISNTPLYNQRSNVTVYHSAIKHSGRYDVMNETPRIFVINCIFITSKMCWNRNKIFLLMFYRALKHGSSLRCSNLNYSSSASTHILAFAFLTFCIVMLRFWLGDRHISGAAPPTSDLLRVGGGFRASHKYFSFRVRGSNPRWKNPPDPESNDLSIEPVHHLQTV